MKYMRAVEHFFRCCVVVAIATASSVTILSAQQLPDADWTAYFGAEDTEPKEYTITTVPLFGPQEFIQRVKPKGVVSIEGRQYRKSVVVHDSGPLANQMIETFVRVSEDGFYQRRSDGTEDLIAPRPLVVGQTWNHGKETLKFEGIEDFETFKVTIPACLKITSVSQESDLKGKSELVRETIYYERGIGLIYKNVSGPIPLTRILSRYAAPIPTPGK